MDWESDSSCAAAATAIGSTGAVSIATGSGLVPDAGDSLILVRLSYPYVAFTSLILKASYTLSQTVYVRPRTNTTISCNNC